MRNQSAIDTDKLIQRLCERNLKPKLILTGFYVDLKMYNDWEKKNQFIPVPRDVAEEYMNRLYTYGYMINTETFKLSFTDALGNQRNINIEISGCVDPSPRSDSTLLLPEHFRCAVTDIDGGYMHIDNIRAIFDITLARIIMGNGDYIRSNLNPLAPDNDRDLY